jgi:hypothetical protein
MLLITYCRVKASDFHIGGYIYTLLCAQIGGAVCAYLLLSPFNEILAQGAFICFFCPTATAAGYNRNTWRKYFTGSHFFPLQSRIGCNTGPVSVIMDGRGEYTRI